MLIETIILWSVQLKLGEFSRSYLLHMFSALILDASADIDAQMKERQQGTVIVETVPMPFKLGEFHRTC